MKISDLKKSVFRKGDKLFIGFPPSSKNKDDFHDDLDLFEGGLVGRGGPSGLFTFFDFKERDNFLEVFEYRANTDISSKDWERIVKEAKSLGFTLVGNNYIKFAPFEVFHGNNPKKEDVLHNLLQILKNEPERVSLVKYIIQDARNHGFDYPEFETIKRASNEL